jgi:PAS domain S-box-containing protein
MMKDEQKTKEQLVEELAELQAKLAEGKLREESLERQSKEAQVILDAAPVMIAYKNKDDHFTRVNAAFANFVGLPAEEILGRTTFDLVEPREVAQRGRDHDLEVIRTGIPVLNQLVQWSGFSSNKTIWALYSKLPFYDSDGTISGTVSFVIDVDDRKKVEDDLIASEKRYRALVENLTAGFVLFEVVQDNNGVPVDLIIIAANKGFETTTGLNTQDVVGKYLTRVLPGIENDAADWIGTYGQVALTGKSREFEQGSEHLGYSYSIVAYQAGPKQCAVTFTDITDRKHIELELIRLERLRAVGELSAGVSHNLNNILTGVILPAQMIKPKINDPELLEEIDVIINSGERARDLARRLHLSVRSIEDDIPEGININEVICEVVHSTRPRWKDETEAKNLIIELVTKLGDDVQYIKGTKSRLFDILNNFIFNAIDAMPEGGRITITTELVKKCVQLVFSDTGTGIDAETVQHIFKPFFTTKKDKGTGLGLSTVYNTVAQWGGEILVESTPGEGTTFTRNLSQRFS